ncbi:MAG: hypothetical protein JWN77_773 [Frankiales bacterium]|nr:hypothetical protein [Frankiales bacterium]
MRVLLGVVVLAAGLTACGGSSAEQPKTLPTLASVSAAPSPSAVAVPSEAAGETPQAAGEFAKYVYAELERAFATKDNSTIARLSLPSCKTCKLYVGSVQRLREMNESITPVRFTVRSAVSPGEFNGVTSVDVTFDFNGSRRTASDGSLLLEEKPQKGVEEELDLKRVNGEWRIAAIKRIRVRG